MCTPTVRTPCCPDFRSCLDFSCLKLVWLTTALHTVKGIFTALRLLSWNSTRVDELKSQQFLGSDTFLLSP